MLLKTHIEKLSVLWLSMMSMKIGDLYAYLHDVYETDGVSSMPGASRAMRIEPNAVLISVHWRETWAYKWLAVRVTGQEHLRTKQFGGSVL